MVMMYEVNNYSETGASPVVQAGPCKWFSS